MPRFLRVRVPERVMLHVRRRIRHRRMTRLRLMMRGGSIRMILSRGYLRICFIRVTGHILTTFSDRHRGSDTSRP